MFSGIIEQVGKVIALNPDGTNLHLTIEAEFSEELYIDQSIAHNGVCLTIVAVHNPHSYIVTAIQETLEKSNLGNLSENDLINLERATPFHARMDGHMVQGHVDTVGICTEIKNVNGSWEFSFSYPEKYHNLIVDKGSIAVNGTSLTVVDPKLDSFKVAIIPYTYHHTIFKHLKTGDEVNLEFDIIGKYVAKHMARYDMKDTYS